MPPEVDLLAPRLQPLGKMGALLEIHQIVGFGIIDFAEQAFLRHVAHDGPGININVVFRQHIALAGRADSLGNARQILKPGAARNFAEHVLARLQRLNDVIGMIGNRRGQHNRIALGRSQQRV